MNHSPFVVFALAALVVTGLAAWCVAALAAISRAVRLPEEPEQT